MPASLSKMAGFARRPVAETVSVATHLSVILLAHGSDAVGRSSAWQPTCRVENLYIAPVFGAGALQASPRVGHLHVIVDDLPWWWADASDNNTVDIAGLPPGPHKVKIELVNANHEVFPGQSKTVAFTIPEGATLSHAH